MLILYPIFLFCVMLLIEPMAFFRYKVAYSLQSIFYVVLLPKETSNEMHNMTVSYIL